MVAVFALRLGCSCTAPPPGGGSSPTARRPAAAQFCGISAVRARLLVFVLVGTSVGLAALTYITRIWTADGCCPGRLRAAGDHRRGARRRELAGGKGSLIGTFSAVLLVSTLNDLLVSHRVDASYQRIILGLVLIGALGIDGVRNRTRQQASPDLAAARR